MCEGHQFFKLSYADHPSFEHKLGYDWNVACQEKGEAMLGVTKIAVNLSGRKRSIALCALNKCNIFCWTLALCFLISCQLVLWFIVKHTACTVVLHISYTTPQSTSLTSIKPCFFSVPSLRTDWVYCCFFFFSLFWIHIQFGFQPWWQLLYGFAC